MRHFVRDFLRATVLGCLLQLAWAGAAWGQASEKPIRIVVPFPPGGIADLFGRQISAKLQTRPGRSVIVENRSGAGGMIGAALVAKGPPDGTMLLVAGQVIVTAPALYKNLSFDPLSDLVPLVQLGSTPNVLVVGRDHPAKSVRDLVEMARRSPGALNYASVGNGTLLHLAAELLKKETGTQIVKISYRGAPETIPAVMTGQVDFMIDSIAISGPHVIAGKLRALAITGPQRDPSLPHVPTMVEAGFPDFVVTTWNAVWISARTPHATAAQLEKELTSILESPEIVESMKRLGVTVTNLPSRAIAKLVEEESRKWAEVLKYAGVEPE